VIFAEGDVEIKGKGQIYHKEPQHLKQMAEIQQLETSH